VTEGSVKVPRSEVFALIGPIDEGVDRSSIGDLRVRMAERPLD